MPSAGQPSESTRPGSASLRVKHEKQEHDAGLRGVSVRAALAFMDFQVNISDPSAPPFASVEQVYERLVETRRQSWRERWMRTNTKANLRRESKSLVDELVAAGLLEWVAP